MVNASRSPAHLCPRARSAVSSTVELALAATMGLVLIGSLGCDGGSGGLDGGDPPDLGFAQPDARVLGPRDAGETGALAPTLTRVSPSTGPVSGGTRVTLRGTAFADPAEVFFGSESAASVAILDEQTIAATTPPGALGPVSVRVVTEGGGADLPNAFTYVRELRLDAVSPARIPDEGGVPVTITGAGFTPETVVLFDRQPLRGRTVVSEERITGFAPALAVGRPEVRIITSYGDARRRDVVVVYGTPDAETLAPGYGPARGGAPQEAAGAGFGDASAVLLGGSAASGLEVVSDGRLRFEAPALSPGVHDLQIENADTRGKLDAAYIAFDSSRADLHVLGTAPARVPRGTATVVAIVGGGFGPGTQVAIGLRRLPLRSLDAHAIEVTLPADLPVGPAQLDITSGGATATARVQVFAPLEVSSIEPTSGPASGGTEVSITGSGFQSGAEVRVGDVPLTDVVVVSDSLISGRTQAGAHGPADVVVRQGGERARLAGGFAFIEPFEVVSAEPREGSVAGNTYVSIIGRGFGAPAAVSFGAEAGASPELENGSIIAVRSPPQAPGLVDLSVEAGSGQATLREAFEYFDPRLLAGGAWGGPIEGAVNVGVIDSDGAPVEGMTVQLGYDADPRYQAVTDANGLATVSSPEIRGAQTVTAGGPDTEFVTFTEIDARNITFISAPHPQSPPPDAPVNPCPTGQQPPVVRGRIFELKSALDPGTNPNIVPVVRITYTQSNVFSANPAMPPEQVDFIFEEGEEYEIVVMRAGTVAVYATLGDLNQETQEFTPRRMGIARGVPVAPETVTDGIDIALDIDMDQTLRIRLDDPPNQNPGPSLNAVFPFLNLESDGVIPFQASFVQGDGEVVLRNMPAVAESEFFYMGGSFSQGQQGGLSSPYSLTLLESSAEFDDGVDLGPFLEMPTNVRPKAGQLLEDGRITWEQGGPTPDLTTLSVVDVRSVGGCCCIDANMNGQCEDGEPQQCGGLPVQYNRWSVFGPGGRQSYALPRMPLDVQAFEPPRAYSYLLQMALAPRFSWREFAYNQFSPFFWQSWVVWSSQLTVKEETD